MDIKSVHCLEDYIVDIKSVHCLEDYIVDIKSVHCLEDYIVDVKSGSDQTACCFKGKWNITGNYIKIQNLKEI